MSPNKFSPTRRSVLAAAAVAAVSPMLHAQAFPAKAIKIVVPYSAGGGLDLIARAVGERMSRRLNQPVIVENRVGANGVIATEAVAKSPPDGYTLVVGVPATIVINPNLYKLNFEPIKDLQAVAPLVVAQFVLVTAPSTGIESLQQFLRSAKATPGKYSFASYGNGSAPHLAGQMLKNFAGLDLVHVPYKGSSTALPDVISGRVSVLFDVVGNVQQHVQSGALKVLASAGERAPAQFPGTPVLKDSFPGFTMDGWVGLFAPSATPAQVVQQLNAAARDALASPELDKKFRELGFDVTPGAAKQFQDLAQRDSVEYARLIRSAGLKVE
jgi:tripartite-type tricarboxylate transporter receptor subunit TctC